MNRDDVWHAIDDERRSLADLLEQLDPADWNVPSLCAGWRVREVAAHLTLAQMAPGPAALALLRAGGDFNRMIYDTALAQAARPTREYPAMLRAMVGSRRKAPGITELEPLTDLLVHGQDIAVPLGHDRRMPPQAAAAAATRVWTTGWPFRAQRRLRGIRLEATDTDWAVGAGVPARGSISGILLVLTGRSAGLAALHGPGVEELARRGDTGRPAAAAAHRGA